MIVVAGTGSGFGGLARYLANGSRGDDVDRAAWTAPRNLLLSDPELAAREMRATAEQNPRVKTPVYHLSVSFAPEDRVGPAEMRQVADRLLEGLGLGEHQALLVGHRDTAHAHFHIMVNRVHPETLRVWRNGHDYARIEQIRRQLERELGLRQVRGPHTRDRPRDRTPTERETRGERREHRRTGQPTFSQRTRARLAQDFASSRSWAELDHRLRRHGYRLQARGRGLVVTDGHRSVKASRIHRQASAHRLAERFGMPYRQYREARAELVVEVRRDRAERTHARRRGAPRPLRLQRAAQRRLARAALRLGREGLSFALKPDALKAVRLALTVVRTLSSERELGR